MNTTYSKFYSVEDAQFLVTLLQQHQIEYSLEHEVNQLDKVYIGEAIEAMFVLKVPAARFNDVNKILADQAKSDMDQPGFEHYLQSYTDTELQEIIDNPAGWNSYDLQVAAMLLSKKTNSEVAVPVDEDHSYPVKLEKQWIVLGYLVSFFALTKLFLLGPAGFFSGLAIKQSKKVLKNGNVVYMYTQADRIHGRNMMILSIVCMLAGAVLIYMRYYSY